MRSLSLHLGVLALLAVLFFVLPPYYAGNLSRIMVLAIYAMGYNILFGYTGLLSLGHAMFFAAGMYGFGLSVQLGGIHLIPAFVIGVVCASALAAVIGFLALRTVGAHLPCLVSVFSLPRGSCAHLLARRWSLCARTRNARKCWAMTPAGTSSMR